jgi:hypothetical protein
MRRGSLARGLQPGRAYHGDVFQPHAGRRARRLAGPAGRPPRSLPHGGRTPWRQRSSATPASSSCAGLLNEPSNCARTRPSGNQGRSKTREGPEDGELAGGHKDPFPLLARRSGWRPRSCPAVRLAWRSCGSVDRTAHPGTLGQDGPKVRQTNLQRARSLDKGLAGLLDRVGARARPPADWLEEWVTSLACEGMDTGDRTLLAGQPWR